MSKSWQLAAPVRLPCAPLRLLIVGSLVGWSVTATGALAAAADADPPRGSIIYLRDVPTRQAQLPGQPGKPGFVDAGPDEVIRSATGIGLTPLTDAQASAVSAPLQRLPVDGAPDAGAGAMGLAAPNSSSPLPASAVEQASGMVSGTVNQAMSSVTSALSSVSDALAGR